ncbi:MAG: isochorismatase family protein [Paracoccaceae bacterium]
MSGGGAGMKALVIVDMQMEMPHRIAAGRACVNAQAPERIAALAAAFRRAGLPVLHVRHSDDNPRSPLHADAPGYPPMPCAEAAGGEAVFVKRTSSAFASTGIEAYLRDRGIAELLVAGAVAGFCVNSTVRHGADLGFAMTVVRDAVIGIDLPGTGLPAQVILDVTLAHLEADFAQVVDTAAVLAGIG